MSINFNEKVPIIIPSYEPDDALFQLCNNLSKVNCFNVIIVDDGSGENYFEIFNSIEKNFKFKILHHEINKGKGRALKTAFKYILDNQNAIGCVTADSDGQHSPTDIIKCINTLMDNQHSLILGCRDFNNDNVPVKSKFGNKLTQKIFAYLCGLKISDTQTGLRGIPINYMKELLNISGERFEFETNMLIESKNKIPILEVPIDTIYDSKENHKTHFNPFLDSLRIYKLFGKIILKYVLSSLTSCAIDLLLFTLLCSIIKSNFPIMYITIATIGARIVSSLYNCLVNYFFVFKSNKGKNNISQSIRKYYILVVVQMFASALFVTVLTRITHNIVNETVIKFVVDICIFFVNYYVQRKYIF